MLSVLKTNFKIRLFLFFVMGCLLFSARDIAGAEDRVLFKGIVNSFKLNVRTKPSLSASVVMIIEKGDQVDVLEKKGGIGGWLTVVFQGKKGYIRNRPKYIILAPVTDVPKKPIVKIKPAIKIKTGLKKESQKSQVNDSQIVTRKKTVIKDKMAIQEKMVTQKKIATQEKIIFEGKKVESFSRKEMEVIEGLNEIDYTLNKARVKSDFLSRETLELGVKIKKIRESRETLASRINDNKVYAGQRLNALYRMRMIGRMDIAGLPSSVFDFFLKQNSMKRVIESDMEVLETQTKGLKKLHLLEEELEFKVATKKELETELNLQIRIKEKETLKKEMILQEIRKKRRLSQAALESLKESAHALDEQLSLLGKEILQPIDDSSFARQKGRLSIPVKGRIQSKFGTISDKDYKSFTFQSGIDIKVERGEPVRSVFKGEVMFAQWLKGYGNLIIINHADNYYTLYAHLEEIFKKKGKTVDTGEVIATAGDTGSIKGVCLHFEVRHHGKPVNPMGWLKKGA
jgi:septal ring factor EnvC (AmiA/AmiB activator)